MVDATSGASSQSGLVTNSNQIDRPRRIALNATVLATIAAISFLGLSPLVEFVHQRRPEPSVNLQPLFVDQTAREIGHVWAAPILRHTFRVANRGTVSLRVTHITTDCSCTSVSPRSLELRPNELCEVTIEIDQSRQKLQMVGPNQGKFTSAVLFTYADGSSQSVELHGTVSIPFAVERLPLEVEAGGKSQFRAWVHPSVSTFVAESDTNDVTVECVKPATDGSPALFEVRANARTTLGRFSFAIVFHGVASDGTLLPETSVSVRGNNDSDFAWSPERVTLVQSLAADATAEQVSLSTRSGRLIDSVELVSAPDFVEVVIETSTLRQVGNAEWLITMCKKKAAPINRGAAGTVLLRVRAAGDEIPFDLPIPVMFQPSVGQADWLEEIDDRSLDIQTQCGSDEWNFQSRSM